MDCYQTEFTKEAEMTLKPARENSTKTEG